MDLNTNKVQQVIKIDWDPTQLGKSSMVDNALTVKLAGQYIGETENWDKAEQAIIKIVQFFEYLFCSRSVQLLKKKLFFFVFFLLRVV